MYSELKSVESTREGLETIIHEELSWEDEDHGHWMAVDRERLEVLVKAAMILRDIEAARLLLRAKSIPEDPFSIEETLAEMRKAVDGDSEA